MRVLVWLFRGFLFFVLFAFALNNLQTATVHWFFGVVGHAPMVIIVLVAFAGGCAVGVLAMVPAWWHHRRAARRQRPAPPPPSVVSPTSILPSEFGAEQPSREGL